MSPLISFFATFGVGHEYAGCYVQIDAENQHTARLLMMGAHSTRWAMLYSASEFAGQAEKWNLLKLAHFQQIDTRDEDFVKFELVRPDERAA